MRMSARRANPWPRLTARGFAVHYIAVVPPADRETLAADRLEGFRDLDRSAGWST